MCLLFETFVPAHYAAGCLGGGAQQPVHAGHRITQGTRSRRKSAGRAGASRLCWRGYSSHSTAGAVLQLAHTWCVVNVCLQSTCSSPQNPVQAPSKTNGMMFGQFNVDRTGFMASDARAHAGRAWQWNKIIYSRVVYEGMWTTGNPSGAG